MPNKTFQVYPAEDGGFRVWLEDGGADPGWMTNSDRPEVRAYTKATAALFKFESSLDEIRGVLRAAGYTEVTEEQTRVYTFDGGRRLLLDKLRDLYAELLLKVADPSWTNPDWKEYAQVREREASLLSDLMSLNTLQLSVKSIANPKR